MHVVYDGSLGTRQQQHSLTLQCDNNNTV